MTLEDECGRGQAEVVAGDEASDGRLERRAEHELIEVRPAGGRERDSDGEVGRGRLQVSAAVAQAIQRTR